MTKAPGEQEEAKSNSSILKKYSRHYKGLTPKIEHAVEDIRSQWIK